MRALTIGVIFGLVLAGMEAAKATPEVKYCKNYQTGQVIVVEANMPCPYPTVEL